MHQVRVSDTTKTVICVCRAPQVTGCSSMVCGPGVCVVGGIGPVCDCTGTGATGTHCEEPSSSPAVSPTSPPLATPGVPRPSASPSPAVSPTPLPLLSCPGSGTVDAPCSGHGTCIRTTAGCTVADLECVASCRWVKWLKSSSTADGVCSGTVCAVVPARGL